jgi:tRNA threonylcarbamoyladenosine biosynthesis protein TsaE
MKQLLLVTHNPEETLELGVHLGEIARPGDIYLLSGNLGVGKTCLTQGIARGLGSREYALSPTFVLMREIHGRLPLYHIDLYRLDRIEEIADLGLDDYLYGEGICVIEWAEKGLGVLPLEHLMIKIDYASADSEHINERDFTIEARGKGYEKLLREIRLKLKK